MAGSAHGFGRQLTIRFDDPAEAGKRAKPRRLARGLPCMASGHVSLPVGDIEVSLGWADVKLRAAGRDGFAAAVDRDVTVALDTTVTPHLRRKALARHLVHHIQMMRKEARLNANDRIRLSVDAQGEVAEAIAEHEAYICTETLTQELRRGPAPANWTAGEADLEMARVVVAMSRA